MVSNRVVETEDLRYMDGYITTKQAAEKWGISVRQVQNHCKNGRISGLQKVGTNYLIPENAPKPIYGFFTESTIDKR